MKAKTTTKKRVGEEDKKREVGVAANILKPARIKTKKGILVSGGRQEEDLLKELGGDGLSQTNVGTQKFGRKGWRKIVPHS